MDEELKSRSLREIPSVEKLLQELGSVDMPRPAVVSVVRHQLAAMRRKKCIPDSASLMSGVREALETLRREKIQPVINGTGVIVHTNLGRSPLGATVANSLSAIAENYSNLEYDVNTGERGHRAAYLEHNFALLCRAESVAVVNNCAAALVLIVRHFTAKKPVVIISRGELVQIGGGFRIPDMLEATGAKLREVGTTNKTTVEDYANAVGRDTALILKVHRSNFFMGGFVESPATESIAQVARAKQIPLVEDLGSGAIVDTRRVAVEREQTPAETLQRGVDLVCFSGDKLLGGPQAGIIAGRARHVAALKREPFFRALRCDKLILSALQTTVDLYLSGEAGTIPALEMLHLSEDALRIRAENLLAQLREFPLRATVGIGDAQVGGGTLPHSVIPSVTLDFAPERMSLNAFAEMLRHATPPLIGYIADGKFKLDLRTIFPRQDEEVVRILRVTTMQTSIQ
jgi:L-seryl-tRNA(Ser) seleniumtransferase